MNHTALRYYKHFDANYNDDDEYTNTATTCCNIDSD
jgi:hypothetical protein